jgi:SWIM zinc finger
VGIFRTPEGMSVATGKISILILYDLTGLTCIFVLHLQITSTNAVEGWHSQLKNNPGALKNEIPKYSLRGCCEHVASVASEYDKNARLKQCEFDSKDVLEAVQFHPTLQKFLYLAQSLISEELHLLYKADTELSNNDEMIRAVDDVISCTCRFWEAFQLPCRHILKQHKEFNTITDKQWDDWLWIWKDSEGFEVYERADRTYATVGIYEAIGGPEPQKLEFREVVDQLQNAFYQKQEELEGQQYPREIRHILMKAWVRSLGRFVGEFRRNAADEIMRQLSAGELAMVRESQETQATLLVRESESNLEDIEMLEQRSNDQPGELQARELDTQQVMQNVLLLAQMGGT